MTASPENIELIFPEGAKVLFVGVVVRYISADGVLMHRWFHEGEADDLELAQIHDIAHTSYMMDALAGALPIPDDDDE